MSAAREGSSGSRTGVLCSAPAPQPPGTEPSLRFKAHNAPTQRGKFPILLQTSPFRGECVGLKTHATTTQSQSPPNSKPPAPPAACAWGWGDATTPGDNQSCCPSAPRLQCGRRAHPRGMQGWRRTRASSSCRHNVQPSVCSSEGRAGTRMLCQQLQPGALSL